MGGSAGPGDRRRRPRPGRVPPAKAYRPRAGERRRAADPTEHALRQHHPSRGRSPLSRRPRHGAPHQEPAFAGTPWPWWSARTSTTPASAATSPPTPRSPRCWKSGFNHFFHAKYGDQPGDLIYFQGHASPGVYARAFLEGRLTEEHLKNFRHELREQPGPVLVSAPVADARFLEVPDRLHGHRPDQRHLPGALHAVPGESRHHPAHAAPHLGVPRRWRNGRARIDGLPHARLAREARQSDLRHQLQPAAPRRSGARQRQGHPGTRSRLPRRRLERPQGHLGRGLGSAAGARHHRPAAKAHGRSGRRRIPELHQQRRRVHPQELLRQISRSCSTSSPTSATTS